MTPSHPTQTLASLSPVDLAVIVLYFAAVVLLGVLLKRRVQTGEDFFVAGREMTAWIAGLSFVAANMGALELMGWAAGAYEYGVLATHWYWVGAIPAMIFLALVMMPFYYISKTHSVPGYLKLRFGESTRALSALSFAGMTILVSGINMFAMAKVMQVVLGWNLTFSIWVSSATIAVYVTLGGLTSAIFNEVLQFMLIWLGALVVPILGLAECGGFAGLRQRILQNASVPSGFLHLWTTINHFGDNPMGIHWTGIVFGLGFVGSFGYWTTDFLVVQRVIAAKDLRSAQLAPIIGAFFKILVPFIVILPGLIGVAVLTAENAGLGLLPEATAGPSQHTYNEVLPLLLVRYAPPGLLGLGITALIAGFMSGMAGNISAFATVWTYDLYRPLLRPNATDAHYLAMGRWSTTLGVLVSIGTAYLAMSFNSIMDYTQALFSVLVTPLFGTVLLGMLWKRITPAGGFWGLLAGIGSSLAMWLWVRHDPSALSQIALSANAKPMAETLYRMLWSWMVCVTVTIGVSLLTRSRPEEELYGLVYGCTELPRQSQYPLVQRPVFWGAAALFVFLYLQWVFR
ncbi:MAG: sodium:solute symporter family protein [Acidobacteriaceae bacterium]|nr:sodium:solute symporter family protein [Acidobacteriaceae bacterium]